MSMTVDSPRSSSTSEVTKLDSEQPKSTETESAKQAPQPPKDTFEEVPMKKAPVALDGGAPVEEPKPAGEPANAQEVVIFDALRAGKTDDATRQQIHDYFKPLNMADSHAAMDRIRQAGLLNQFIDATVRDEHGNQAAPEVKAALKKVFETGRLDVYAETVSSTTISMGAYDGLFFQPDKNGVFLKADAVGDTQNLANILAHELYHAFNQAHGGPDGALNEGFGIAAREYAFSDGNYNLAEMVYGTKNYYRDLMNQPNYPFGDVSKADPKLMELLNAFGSRDKSQLAWQNPKQLESEYKQFFEGINRNQDWDSWLAAVEKATNDMLAARNASQQQQQSPIDAIISGLKKLFGN